MTKIPDHDLLCRIGKGSYGDVWLARNIMGTFRAIKIVFRSTFETSGPYDRELAGIQRFEPISRSHEGFVDILQIGKIEEEACFYYVMEAADDLSGGPHIDPATYVPKTLGKILQQTRRFSVKECVEIGMALCQAMERLHQHDLVHRDIKPSNIVFVNNTPKLADVGLVARAADAKSIVGTEGFIPPEGAGSPQADIFSLGKVLYELATGRDRQEYPSLPTKLGDFTDTDQFLELNEVLIRACRPDARERYQSAREMFEDLALVASGKSLRRLRTIERRFKSLRRNLLVGATVLFAAALVSVPLYEARQSRAEVQSRQAGIHSANGLHHVSEGDFLGSLPDFSALFRLEETQPNRVATHQMRIASLLASAPRLSQMFFLDGQINCLQFGADGKSLLITSRNHSAYWTSVSSGQDIIPPFGPPMLYQSALSPDNRFAVCASERNTATVWDLATGMKRFELPHESKVFCARYSPNGQQILTGSKDGVARIWDVETRTVFLKLCGHTDAIRGVSFSSDGKFCATVSYDGSARIWDATTGTCLSESLRHEGNKWVVDVDFSPDCKTLVTAGHDYWARRWRVPGGETIPSLSHHTDGVSAVRYSPDGKIIATASFDTTVRLWDAATSMPLNRNPILQNSSGVMSLCFSPDSKRLAVGCSDGTVRVWDFYDVAIPKNDFAGTVDDGGRFVAIIQNEHVSIQQTDNRKTIRQFFVTDKISQSALSQDGRRMAVVVSENGRSNTIVKVFETANGREIFTKHSSTTNQFSKLMWSADGSFLLAWAEELRGFEVSTGAELPFPKELSLGSPTVDIAKTRIAMANGKSFGIFNLRDRKLEFPLLPLRAEAHRVRFSPSGQSVIICLADNLVQPQSAQLLEINTRLTMVREFWHRDGVLDCSFRPDGRHLITAGEDRRALIWDLRNDKMNPIALPHNERVIGCEFSPRGDLIATASADGTTTIWDADTGVPIVPPQLQASHQIVFFANGTQLAFMERPNHWSTSLIPKAQLSANEVTSIAELMTSQTSTESPIETPKLRALWERSKDKWPTARNVWSFSMNSSNSDASISR